jgi:hypothetical protein
MTLIMRPRNSHIWARSAQDHYVEPSWCSERLFQVEPFTGSILDPAEGFGTIVRAAKAAGYDANGSDLVDRGGGQVSDFFESATVVDNIVSNPPFDQVHEFLVHALKLTRHKVAMICPTARLNAARWLKATPLARIWLLTPRPSMPPGHVIATGEKPGGGKTDFCWLVFDHGHIGGSRLDWLQRDVS